MNRSLLCTDNWRRRQQQQQQQRHSAPGNEKFHRPDGLKYFLFWGGLDWIGIKCNIYIPVCFHALDSSSTYTNKIYINGKSKRQTGRRKSVGVEDDSSDLDSAAICSKSGFASASTSNGKGREGVLSPKSLSSCCRVVMLLKPSFVILSCTCFTSDKSLSFSHSRSAHKSPFPLMPFVAHTDRQQQQLQLAVSVRAEGQHVQFAPTYKVFLT